MIKYRSYLSRLGDIEGITLIRLIVFFACLVLAFVVATIFIEMGRKAAYEITAKYDLRQFIDAEMSYYAEHDEFKGEVGEVVSGEPSIPSTFDLEGFTPSKGIVVTVTSRYPFIVSIRHVKGNVIFEYNFQDQLMKRIENR